MKTKNTNTGLQSPITALSIANSAANTEEGKKAIGQGVNAVKYLIGAFGVIAIGKLGYSQFKKIRSDRFARENVGNPNLTAAAIIYDSFTRLGFPDSSVLSYLIPSVNISTDESALYEIATQVTNVKAVSEAYTILFDRSLFKDIHKGLDTDELKRFWNIINSPSANNQKTLYPIGSKLYSGSKNKITVNIAVKENGSWKGTGELYNTFNFREEVGEVIAHGVHNGENYYIVEQFFWSGLSKKQGVVLQHQVTNEKI
ncbi:hypothetical protein [uncultured Tenacibaculum sp.]|uniref:hypothetical protein n=1 Tax=uncultured Tenacibaculum sp. TaxID=174713 RepID=UPI00262D1A93|nr:hypothetical protein [uncultured Tenacibaculum sp.]